MLIERGYVYNALSPLYKVERGRKIDFIKNEVELKKFFISELKDFKFTLYDSDAEVVKVNSHIIKNLAAVKDIFNYISAKYSVDADTVGMILNLSSMYEINDYNDIAASLLDYYTEIGYEGLIYEEGIEADIIIGHDDDGKIFSQSIDEALYHAYIDCYNSLKTVFGSTVLTNICNAITIQIEDKEAEFTNIFKVISILDIAVSKKARIIRQKGLGEINAEDLGLTTINPLSREIVQLQIDPETNETVYNLMSKKTREYRKDYVKNIDSSHMEIDI